MDAATARRAVQMTARDIGGANEKQQVLAALAGKYLDDKETLPSLQPLSARSIRIATADRRSPRC